MFTALREIYAVLKRPCREHTEIYSRALDGEHPRIAMIGVRIHTLYCKSCRRFCAQLRRLHTMTAALGRDLTAGTPMPADVRDRLTRRIDDTPEKI